MRTFKVGQWQKQYGPAGLEWNVDSEDERGARAVIAACPTEDHAQFFADAATLLEWARDKEAVEVRYVPHGNDPKLDANWSAPMPLAIPQKEAV